jgi:hypothetical protein
VDHSVDLLRACLNRADVIGEVRWRPLVEPVTSTGEAGAVDLPTARQRTYILHKGAGS